jgi:lysophospholipase L1-like esterase
MKIIALGDSLMQFNSYKTYPQTGWPQELPRFLKDPKKVPVWDFALNGSSTKSIIDKGNYAKALKAAEKGDLVLISFGHNDEKSYDPARYTEPFKEYQANLRKFYEEFTKKGCKVVFLSSIARMKFDTDGKHLLKTHGDYPRAMKELAKELQADFIDLESISTADYEKHDFAYDSWYIMYFGPGHYPNYPQGKSDTTHLTQLGAFNICCLVVPELKKIPMIKDLFI